MAGNLWQSQLPRFRCFGMVSRRAFLFEEAQLALFLKLVIYEYPRAVHILIYLALTFVLPAAWPVDQALRAAGDGADRTGKL